MPTSECRRRGRSLWIHPASPDPKPLKRLHSTLACLFSFVFSRAGLDDAISAQKISRAHGRYTATMNAKGEKIDTPSLTTGNSAMAKSFQTLRRARTHSPAVAYGRFSLSLSCPKRCRVSSEGRGTCNPPCAAMPPAESIPLSVRPSR